MTDNHNIFFIEELMRSLNKSDINASSIASNIVNFTFKNICDDFAKSCHDIINEKQFIHNFIMFYKKWKQLLKITRCKHLDSKNIKTCFYENLKSTLSSASKLLFFNYSHNKEYFLSLLQIHKNIIKYTVRDKLCVPEKNSDLTDQICKSINENIISLQEISKTNTDITNIIKNIRKYISYGCYVCKKSKFINTYEQYLQYRLQHGYDNDIEKEFITSFNIFPNMCRELENVIIRHNEIIKIPNNLDVCYAIINNNFYSISDTKFKLCSELLGFDILVRNSYNNKRPNVILTVNNNLSTCVAELYFDKIYNIEMTLSQYIVFKFINDENFVTATSISNVLEIEISLVGIILNSLIVSGLLLRSNGNNDDVNLIFYVNGNFCCECDNITIVNNLQLDNVIDKN